MLLTSARYECQNMSAKNKKWHSKVALILSLLSEPLTPTQIQKLTKIPRRSLFRYLKFLYKSGLVEKQRTGNIVLYRITQLGYDYLKQSKTLTKLKRVPKRSMGTSGGFGFGSCLSNVRFVDGVRVHNVVVKIPIVRDNGRLPAEKLNELRNWVERYFRLEGFEATFKKTTRHVVAYLYCFELPANLSFFVNLGLYLAKFLINLERVLWRKYRILIDVDKAVIVNQHIANVSDVLSKVSSKSRQVQVNLNRKAVSALNTLDQEAWAKIDWSKGRPEIETNDLAYEEKLLLMPEKVFSLDLKLNRLCDVLSKFVESFNMFLNGFQQAKRGVDYVT